MPIRFGSSNDDEQPRSALSSTKEKMKSILPTSRHHRGMNSSSGRSQLHPDHTSASQYHDQPQQHHHPNPLRTSYQSTHSAPTSAATSRSTTATSTFSAQHHHHHHHRASSSIRDAVLRAQEVTPTSDVAEWAHQMHLAQRRSYWWCQGCFPKTATNPLEIPRAVEKMIENRRRVRIVEPETAYD